MSFALIAIAAPLYNLFTYRIPAGMDVRVGSRVFVPFGKRTVVGYVMEKCADPKLRKCMNDRRGEVDIKDVIDSPDPEPVFTEDMVGLLMWIADYYCAPIGDVCKAALPAGLTKKAKRRTRYAMLKETEIDDVFLSAPEVVLTASQQRAYNEMKTHLAGGGFRATLLHGVTGSGKTEVYLRLFADIIGQGKQGILLVPEIGMTPQAVGRVVARFGKDVSVYHSSLTDARRLYEWKRMQSGEARIVIGTRSAVFAPFRRLGLIVLDEEHDPSYKQDETPRYNGRDTAVMRAKIEGIPCILGSATPSMESYANAMNKKYHYIHLPDRPAGSELPSVEVVDMRDVPKGACLSPRMINAISENLQKKGQTILFLNRRGYANFILCQDCGEPFICPNCNITLTLHRGDRFLLCHYCEHKVPAPRACWKCGSPRIRPFGTGTEKIEAEIKEYFPDARVARLDRDSVMKKGERSKIYKGMKEGDTDIMIGTQMITKGHDFPNVSLVGVIDADISLNFPDFRAPERTFQLITQVAGRAGRREARGHVIIQTFTPGHYAIATSKDHDFHSFFREELSHRRELNYPPYGRLVLIRVQGAKDGIVENVAHDIAARISKDIKDGHKATVLGPSPAPISRIRGRSRWHILIKSNNIRDIRPILGSILAHEKGLSKGVKVMVDVDPVNML